MADQRPYVDTPVGDVAAATTAARGAAAWFGIGPPTLLRASMNAVFVADDAVLRVARPSVPAERSLELAAHLIGAGIRTPRPIRDTVWCRDGYSVTAWERLHPIEEAPPWSEVGAMIRRLHELEIATIPDGVPLPHPARFPWWRFDELLGEVADDLDDAASAGLRAAVERGRGWELLDRDDEVVCHGDVHPGNVVATCDGPALVDWDLLCRAPRWWDHTPLLRWAERWGGRPGTYEAFVEGYGRSYRSHPTAEAVADLRLVAATIMAVRRSRALPDDTEAAAEAERRLATWRDPESSTAWRAR